MLYYSSHSSNFSIFTLLHHPLLSTLPLLQHLSISIQPFYHIYSSVGRTGLVLDETHGWSLLYPHPNNSNHQHLEAQPSLCTLMGI